MDVRGQYELLERSIGAVLGDFEKVPQIFREQQELALKSPFTVLIWLVLRNSLLPIILKRKSL